MREFGESPKRAGTVSGREGRNARGALNVSSPLEKSEKVGIGIAGAAAPYRKSGDLLCAEKTGPWSGAVILLRKSGRGSLLAAAAAFPQQMRNKEHVHGE